MKQIFLVLLVFLLASCAPEEALFEMTLAELAEYDGLDGEKAYIAVDGYIYDVTNSDSWNNGMHNSYQAGQDLSDEILLSPHGKDFLNRVPKVGILVEEASS
jgi:predicted heme/steroid binding protein